MEWELQQQYARSTATWQKMCSEALAAAIRIKKKRNIKRPELERGLILDIAELASEEK